ncbi:MAG: branched-chain amino acid ABC transporter substrate-binding protein, partial [Patescibacteria group bacterium]
VLILIGGVANKKEVKEGEKEPIKIGGVLSLTGAASSDGESIKKGMELAKADLEAQGVEVELIYQDDKTEAKDTVSAINAISTQGVEAIIGPTWSFLGDAGVPVADRLKLVTIMPANTSEYVSARSPYAFFTSTKVSQMTPVLIQWLKENNKKRIVLVYNQAAWGEVVAKTLRDSAKEAGAEIVFTESIPYGSEVDAMSTILAKIQSLKSDLLFFEVDDDKGIVTLLKKAKEFGINSDIMSVTTSVGRIFNSGVSKPTNTFYVVSPVASEVFKVKFNEFYKTNPGAYADRAYDSVMLIADAIQKKGDDTLSDYLRNKSNYQGLSGDYKFDENGDVIGGEWVVEKLE